jgi:hypothetical protein
MIGDQWDCRENIPFGYFTSCIQSSTTNVQNTGCKGAPFRSLISDIPKNTDGMITCLIQALLVACLLFRGVLAAEYLVGVGKDETTG